ncbi:MAG: tetratricopeptide repeat protein [Acidobacteriota bacterium]|nr:tetratricopeptide repeat protein [Acidobacteriota bacterium]
MGTTKLTRKEILAEDPVHEAIVQFIEFFRANSKKIGIAVVVIVLLALGIYGGLQYLDRRETQAQERLAKGMDFFHAPLSPDATDDPYAKGATPTFKGEQEKFKAAAKEFSAIVEGQSFGKVPVIARYYLGLSQLRLGEKQEAIRNLEMVSSNSKERTLGFLAKKVLATEHFNSGNHKGAGEILQSLIRDPQCQLPKGELSLQLSRVLVAQGKREEAIKVLRDASSQGAAFSSLQQKLATELDALQRKPVGGANP